MLANVRSVFVAGLSVLSLSAACASSGAPAARLPPPSGGTLAASDTCAGDTWLPQILGRRAELVSAMSVAGMRRTHAFGSQFISRDRVEMDHLAELQQVPNAAAEVYEWEGPPRAGSSSGHETSRVIVLRQAFGDPRALKGDGADLYAPPVTLPNGAMEFAPTRANVETPFAPTGGKTIFTFADGTWVQVDGWMAQRFRPTFGSAGPPPLPPSAGSAAWEICALFDAREAARSGTWGAAPVHGVLRLFATGDGKDGELVFRFASPDLAARAAAEQRERCAQPAFGKGGDKGLFSLIPPCEVVASPSLDGPMLRYALRL